MALGKETDPDLKLSFHDLRELRVDVAYPFLLELYHDYSTGMLSREDFVAAVRLIESYVFRRAICSIPTNSLNKTFATFARSLKKDRYLESIQANLLLLPSYRRFPSNEEFRRELQTRDLYNFRSRSYLLRRLENYGRKERVQVDEYTIEHIMLESLRRRLRDLVKLIEKHHRKPIYTDFEDEMGRETDVELPGFAEAGDFEKFRAKTRAFLLEHQDNTVIHKLRMNIPLAAPDLDELERILSESGLGGPEEIALAKEVSHGSID